MNRKQVERIWRREGLKAPQKQPKRSQFWHNDGSCIRLRPEYPGHMWSYDFVEGHTHDGRKFRILSIIDEASREGLALPVARRLRERGGVGGAGRVVVTRGPPAHIRSDNGPEFIATAMPPSDSATRHLRPAMAPEATMHQQSTGTTRWGPVRDGARAAIISLICGWIYSVIYYLR